MSNKKGGGGKYISKFCWECRAKREKGNGHLIDILQCTACNVMCCRHTCPASMTCWPCQRSKAKGLGPSNFDAWIAREA